MKSLRESLPRLESEWMLPAWLLITILTAAVAETWTIGIAIHGVYDLYTGWAVGGVVASAQALGSMMWARASRHNAQRHIRYKSVGRKGEKRRVEDRANSEPPMNVHTPLVVSVVAGAISFLTSAAMYGVDGLTILDVALSFAAPAGSIAAALLNGVFAADEGAVERWRAQRDGKTTTARPQKSVRNRTIPHSSHTDRVSGTVFAQGDDAKSPDEPVDDVTEGLSVKLVELRERIQHERQLGHVNGTFKRADVEKWLGISKSYALSVINTGVQYGVLEKASRGKYKLK